MEVAHNLLSPVHERGSNRLEQEERVSRDGKPKCHASSGCAEQADGVGLGGVKVWIYSHQLLPPMVLVAPPPPQLSTPLAG